jgi:hypothetical protein
MLVIVALSKIFLIFLTVLECYGFGSLFRPAAHSIGTGQHSSSAVLAGQMDNTAMFRPVATGQHSGSEVLSEQMDNANMFRPVATGQDSASELPAGKMDNADDIEKVVDVVENTEAVVDEVNTDDNIQHESTMADMPSEAVFGVLGLILLPVPLVIMLYKVNKQRRMKSMPKEAHEDTQQQHDNA